MGDPYAYGDGEELPEGSPAAEASPREEFPGASPEAEASPLDADGGVVAAAWPSRRFMIIAGTVTVVLLAGIVVMAVLLSDLLKARDSGTGTPPPCNDVTNPCKDKDQFCNAQGRCVPSIATCDEATATRCGGDKYCYKDEKQDKSFCHCLHADGTAADWLASADDSAAVQACTAPPSNQTVVDAYRAAGGADGDDVDGIKNYVAWDEVTGRWGLRFRAKAAAAGWDETKDAIPLLHTKDQQKGPDAGFCISHLPASALDEPEFFKCKPGQVCGAYKDATGKDANGCIDRPAPPATNTEGGGGMVWWVWLLIAFGVVAVPLFIGVFVTVVLPRLRKPKTKIT